MKLEFTSAQGAYLSISDTAPAVVGDQTYNIAIQVIKMVKALDLEFAGRRQHTDFGSEISTKSRQCPGCVSRESSTLIDISSINFG